MPKDAFNLDISLSEGTNAELLIYDDYFNTCIYGTSSCNYRNDGRIYHGSMQLDVTGATDSQLERIQINKTDRPINIRILGRSSGVGTLIYR